MQLFYLSRLKRTGRNPQVIADRRHVRDKCPAGVKCDAASSSLVRNRVRSNLSWERKSWNEVMHCVGGLAFYSVR